METKDKIQRVLDVIDGKAHPSTLVEVLPKPEEQGENVVRMAVDYLMARQMERVKAPASNSFRLVVTDTLEVHEGNEVKKQTKELHVTDWTPERSQLSVPTATAELRKQYPREAISVERAYGAA